MPTRKTRKQSFVNVQTQSREQNPGSGTGPDSYDGRERKNAGQPPDPKHYYDTPGAIIKTND